jgi:hypothetical protein
MALSWIEVSTVWVSNFVSEKDLKKKIPSGKETVVTDITDSPTEGVLPVSSVLSDDETDETDEEDDDYNVVLKPSISPPSLLMMTPLRDSVGPSNEFISPSPVSKIIDVRDNSPSAVNLIPRSSGYKCDGCNKDMGSDEVRYHCTECNDFDLCSVCYEEKIYGSIIIPFYFYFYYFLFCR